MATDYTEAPNYKFSMGYISTTHWISWIKGLPLSWKWITWDSGVSYNGGTPKMHGLQWQVPWTRMLRGYIPPPLGNFHIHHLILPWIVANRGLNRC